MSHQVSFTVPFYDKMMTFGRLGALRLNTGPRDGYHRIWHSEGQTAKQRRRCAPTSVAIALL